MSFYWIKTSVFIKKIFHKLIWDIPNNGRKVYLTFDDGPIPNVTEWVLSVLEKENIKATFFCIGNNIKKHPEIFKKIILSGHVVGNHTFNHLNGWKTNDQDYINNVLSCQDIISGMQLQTTYLYRPPYGKVKFSQSKQLRKLGYKIIMWDVLSADFDQSISKQKCFKNATQKVQSGSIIVFHDSIKAYENLKYALPKTIKALQSKGFVFDVLRC